MHWYRKVAALVVALAMVGVPATQAVAAPLDVKAPVVSINTPRVGAVVSGIVFVTVTATDKVGVHRVEYYEDGELVYWSSPAPSNPIQSMPLVTTSWTWDTTKVLHTATGGTVLLNGKHSLSAKAYDVAGNVGTSSAIAVTVKNASPLDKTAPVVSITAPSNNGTVSATVNTTVNATDNVKVTKVAYYLDGALVNTTTASPFGWAWNTVKYSEGKHSLVAKAYDAAGNNSMSNVVSITVNNVPLRRR
jgi:Bacterial Ig domain